MEKIYQIVDENGKYRSRALLCGEEVDFISKNRKEAIVYTLDEAKKIAKYYIEEKNIPVMLETRYPTSKRDI